MVKYLFWSNTICVCRDPTRVLCRSLYVVCRKV